jgi:hypothetical protein
MKIGHHLLAALHLLVHHLHLLQYQQQKRVEALKRLTLKARAWCSSTVPHDAA